MARGSGLSQAYVMIQHFDREEGRKGKGGEQGGGGEGRLEE